MINLWKKNAALIWQGNIMKLSNWRVEYTVTLMVLYTIILIIIPTSIKSTVQANIITKWKDTYQKMNYVQDAILKQEQSEILTSLKKAKTANDREDLIITIMKPYIRLKDAKVPRRYKVKYMDKTSVKKDDYYYITDYYYTDNNMIVGIKDIPETNENNENNDTIFIMTFDINGLLPPNTWGRDIFGVKVHTNKVEPFGQTLTIEKQYYDCSKNGTGTGCSNFYLIGGDFSD